MRIAVQCSTQSEVVEEVKEIAEELCHGMTLR